MIAECSCCSCIATTLVCTLLACATRASYCVSGMLSYLLPHQRSLVSLSHSNLVRRDTAHDNQRIMRNHPQRTIVPSLATLLTTVRVPNSIHNTVDAPHSAEDSCSDGPPQTRDQECADDGGVVLAKVLVRALSRVEGKHGLLRCGRGRLDLLVGGVFEGVRDLCGFAEGADAASVPGTDEEGADDGAKDVAGDC